MKLTKTIFSIAIVFVMAFNMFNINAFAQDNFDPDATATIDVNYKYNSTPLDDVTFKVYQVATLNEDAEYEVTEDFEDLDIECDELCQEEYLHELRDDLEICLDCNQIESYLEFRTCVNGQYTIEDLELGFYLMEAEAEISENEIFYSEPVLFFAGQYCYDAQKWNYDLTVTPKVAKEEYIPVTDVSVTKVWKNVDSNIIKPQAVEIGLYRNGKIYDSVILNSDNNWTHTWKEMDPYQNWEVLEITELENFTVDYTNNYFNFTVTNTYVDKDEEIPQTGSFANQIPIYSGVGLVLILFGVLLKNKGKKDET